MDNKLDVIQSNIEEILKIVKHNHSCDIKVKELEDTIIVLSEALGDIIGKGGRAEMDIAIAALKQTGIF